VAQSAGWLALWLGWLCNQCNGNISMAKAHVKAEEKANENSAWRRQSRNENINGHHGEESEREMLISIIIIEKLISTKI